jgi:hypothetical protein
MMCPFPKLERTIASVLKGEFSLYLDAVRTWEDLSSYPQFNSVSIVPDPVVFQFSDAVYVLKSNVLEIEVTYYINCNL